MSDVPSTSWSSILPSIGTGDLMLWSRPNDLTSQNLAKLADCPFSHVAMLVAGGPGVRPQLWQATSEVSVGDPIQHGQPHSGAQFGDAEEVLQIMSNSTYGMIPYYRPLKFERTHEFERAVIAAIKAFDGTPFPSDAVLATHAAEGRLFNMDSGTADLFCAQLVAATYQGAGLLGREHPANWYNQGSFGGIGKFADDCVLLQGAAWGGPAVRIELPLA